MMLTLRTLYGKSHHRSLDKNFPVYNTYNFEYVPI